MVRPRHGVLTLLTLLAILVRVAFLAAEPHPFFASGLAADSAEIARQIDDHGRWFTSNLTALHQVSDLQDRRHRLIDPASLDLRAADAHPRWQAEALEPPGEPIVLAALWKLTGSQRWLPYQLLMIVIDSLCTLLVFYIGIGLFRSRPAGLVAAGLYAVFPPIAWLTTIPHLDVWAVDLTIAVTALLVRARSRGWPSSDLLVTGGLVGLGSYFRPELILLAPLVALAGLGRDPWRVVLKVAVLPSLLALLLLAPWTVRNAEVFHRFIPVRIGIGQNLWEGLGELPNSFGAHLDDAATYAQVHAVRSDLAYGTPGYDSYLEAWALRVIRRHPVFYLRLVGKRLADSTVLLSNRDWSQGFASKALEPLLFLISLLSVILSWRRFAREHLILVAVVLGTVLPYLFLHFEPRYVLPASFAYLLWTGLGATLLIERLRRRPLPSLAHVRHLRHPRDVA